MNLKCVIRAYYSLTARFWQRAMLSALVFLLAACGGLAGEPKIVATVPSVPIQTQVVAQDTGYPVQAPDVSLGAQIYAARCTGCHGVNGDGSQSELILSGQLTVPPPDFSDPATARVQTPAEWFATITNGRMDKLMPPWSQALTEDERWAVALYTYTMARSPEQVARGQAIWEANCAECHGATGVGDGPNAPQPIADLTLQSAMVTLSDEVLFTAVTDGLGRMPAFGDTLSDDQRWDAIAYARTFSLSSAASATQAGQDSVSLENPLAATTSVPGEQLLGTVSGSVGNGTEGGGVPPDLALTLHVLDLEGGDQTFDTTVNPDSTYRFENVPFFAPADYYVLAHYQDRLFGRGQGIDDTTNINLDLPITIFELTDDPSVIRITGVLLQVIAASDGLQITQVMTVENTSDRAFTTSETAGEDRYVSLKTTLPLGAQLIDLDSTSRYAVSDDLSTVMDTRIVYPGAHDPVHMIYYLPYVNGATIQQTLNYAVDGPVRVLLEQGDLSVVSDQLPAVGPQQLGDGTYQGYGADLTLSAGSTLRFDVRGDLPNVSTFGGESNVIPTSTIIAVAVIVIGLAIVIAGGMFYLRGHRPAAGPSVGDQQLMDGLVRQIAELDETYHAGELDEDTYRRRRRKLKTRLAELMEAD